MADGLAELENAVLLPHLGSATRGTRNLMATKAANNALRDGNTPMVASTSWPSPR